MIRRRGIFRRRSGVYYQARRRLVGAAGAPVPPQPGGTFVSIFFTSSDVPLISPVTPPNIEIRRVVDGALVLDDAMSEVGGGWFTIAFTPAVQEDYVCTADGDPLNSGQVTAAERYRSKEIPGLESAYIRKILTNRALTTVLTGGAKQIQFFEDDAVTVLDSITVSADGLERTRP